MLRIRTIFLCSLLIGSSMSSLAAADREHQVKTGFLFNFAKFCEWDSLGNADAPFVVGIYKTDAYGGDLQASLRGKSVAGHPISVQAIDSADGLAQCRIAVVGDLKADQIKHLVNVCHGSGTLLVGESTDFARNGGTIGFVIREHNVRFEVNLQSAKTDHVQLSAKLLSLAVEVFR